MKETRKYPFCGYPYGFHEFDTKSETPEDDCCVHCGYPRRILECTCPEWDKDPHPDFTGICVRCGKPFGDDCEPRKGITQKDSYNAKILKEGDWKQWIKSKLKK